MKSNHNYQQQSGQGCLVACLAYLCSIEPNRSMEGSVLLEGLFLHRDSYALGITEAFISQTRQNLQLQLSAGNPVYTTELQVMNQSESLLVSREAINKHYLTNLKPPYVVYIDSYGLGSQTHQPHFILVQERNVERLKIYDPWVGQSRVITAQKLYNSVESLRRYLRYSPIVITLAQ